MVCSQNDFRCDQLNLIASKLYEVALVIASQAFPVIL